MAKAICVKVYNVVWETNKYVFAYEACVEDGAGDSHLFTGEFESTSFQPLLPNLRTICRNAIIAKADADYEIEVDDVLFQDMIL